VAESIIFFFRQKQNQELLQRLKEAGLKTEEEKETGAAPSQGRFAGMTFVLTGELNRFTRDEAREIIENLGGKVTSSVSRKTTVVIVGQNPGSKLQRAQELNIPIWTEEEFLHQAGQAFQFFPLLFGYFVFRI